MHPSSTDLLTEFPWLGRLADTLGDATITAVSPLAGGACQDNFRIDGTSGGVPFRYALRSDARSSLPGSLDRAAEAQAIRAAVAADVPTPGVCHELADLLREGATATVLEWRDGVAIAAKVLKDPRLAAAREALPGQLAAALVRIHSVGPDRALSFRPSTPWSSTGEDAVEPALAFTRWNLDTLPDPYPSLELALRWLSEHRPAPRPARLVHGDFRMGNFLVGPAGLTAVLDWEFAHWGSPAEDLGWLCVRDWRFGRLPLAAGGLTTRHAFFDAYTAAGGGPVDPAEVHWWEILGNLRWAAGAAHQTQRVLTGAEADLELLVIGRRVSEMAFEALRLIDVGAS